MNTQSRRGSVLVLTIITIGVVAIILGGLVNYALTEKRNNHRQYLWLHARNAAEAVVDSGLGELINRFSLTEAFPHDSLAPTRNPLFLPEGLFALYDTSASDPVARLVLPSDYDKTAPPGSYATEIVGGTIPPPEPVYLNPQDPANEDDEMRGMTVLTTPVTVLGRATVEDPAGLSMTARACADLLVRDAPLFSHAIFYNMDLEIAPSPNMNIIGKVHTNGDLFYQMSTVGNTLNFQNLVSSAQQIFWGRKPGSGQSNTNGDVFFMSGRRTDGSPVMVSHLLGGQAMDENMTDFRSRTANAYNYWVQSAAHGMGTHKSIAMRDYVPDDPATPEADDDLNYAYQIIMPVESSQPTAPEAREVERQKFAYKAGLTIELTESGDLKLYSYARNGKDLVYDEDGQPSRIELQAPAITLGGAADDIVRVQYDQLYDARERSRVNLVDIDVGRLKKAIEAVDVWQNPAVPGADALKTEAQAILSGWGVDPADLAGGAVPHDQPAYPGAFWNGVVYVKLPLADPAATRPDGVKPARDGWAVRVRNGAQLPNPDFARARDIYGLTLATNGPLYVQGHYNANGTYNSNNETTADAPWADQYNPHRAPLTAGGPGGLYPEASAALAGDAVTILSGNWSDANSANSVSTRNASAVTEVSAAIIAGLVPSGKAGYDTANFYSGGVENFPRFLETWGTSRSLVYRGSMVCLFESELATGRWGLSNVYSPPRRLWGFNTLFAQGYYPPGTPMLRVFKRVNFRWLTEDEYSATLAHIRP